MAIESRSIPLTLTRFAKFQPYFFTDLPSGWGRALQRLEEARLEFHISCINQSQTNRFRAPSLWAGCARELCHPLSEKWLANQPNAGSRLEQMADLAGATREFIKTVDMPATIGTALDGIDAVKEATNHRPRPSCATAVVDLGRLCPSLYLSLDAEDLARLRREAGQ